MSAGVNVVAFGEFDDIRAHDIRFLEEASKLGALTVLLWPDEAVRAQTGHAPKFPLPERLYFLNALRYVSHVAPLAPNEISGGLPALHPSAAQIWVEHEADYDRARERLCRERGMEYRILTASEISGFPNPLPMPSPPGRKRVIATGCYDWFHSGHVRFTEEASAYGDLYVVVGHDANIRLLKGEGHPLLPQDERRYVVGSIRFVTQALIATGNGWLDAEPEIDRIRPDAYIVNEDGDKGGKREFCRQKGLEYIVLKRTPAPGLPARSSTNLRGF